jgi:hypothetical protein
MHKTGGRPFCASGPKYTKICFMTMFYDHFVQVDLSQLKKMFWLLYLTLISNRKKKKRRR